MLYGTNSVIAGLFYNFTNVKMKGPNKSLLNWTETFHIILYKVLPALECLYHIHLYIISLTLISYHDNKNKY